MKFLQGCYLFWQYLHSHLPTVSQLHCLTLLLFILLAVYTRTGLYSRMNYRYAAIPRSLSYDFSIPFISFSFFISPVLNGKTLVHLQMVCHASSSSRQAALLEDMIAVFLWSTEQHQQRHQTARGEKESDLKSYIFTSICLKEMLFANPWPPSASCTRDCDISTRGDSLWLSGTWEEFICCAVDLFVSIHLLEELQIEFLLFIFPRPLARSETWAILQSCYLIHVL